LSLYAKFGYAFFDKSRTSSPLFNFLYIESSMYLENTEEENNGYVIFKGTAKWLRTWGGGVMSGINRWAFEYYISADFLTFFRGPGL
jgi:hypothetical protein